MRIVEGHVVYEGVEKLKQRIERAKASVTIFQLFDSFSFDYRSEGNFYCPFHSDAHPSARIYGEGQYFKCFAGSCDFKGDVVAVAARITGGSVVNATEFLEAAFGLYDKELPELEQSISLYKYKSQCESAVMDYYVSIQASLKTQQKYEFEQVFLESYESRLMLNAWFVRNGEGNAADFMEVQRWTRDLTKGLSAWERAKK